MNRMNEEPQCAKHLFCGVIWPNDDQPGVRFEIIAADLDEAKRLMEERFGVGHEYTLSNPDDEDKPR